LGERGGVVSECSVVDLVNENTQESDGLVVGIGLELRVDFDDECRGDRGEKTRLRAQLARVHQVPTKNSRKSKWWSGPRCDS
jgi:hypothetical protein